MILILFLAVLALILAYAVKYQPFKAPIPEAKVVLKDDSFEPESLTITKGTMVIFQNEGSKPHWPASNLHPTHGIYPEFDPQIEVPNGQSWSFVFEKPGKWKYHDHLYPEIRGEINVSQK